MNGLGLHNIDNLATPSGYFNDQVILSAHNGQYPLLPRIVWKAAAHIDPETTSPKSNKCHLDAHVVPLTIPRQHPLNS